MRKLISKVKRSNIYGAIAGFITREKTKVNVKVLDQTCGVMRCMINDATVWIWDGGAKESRRLTAEEDIALGTLLKFYW